MLLRGGTMVLVSERAVSERAGGSAGDTNVQQDVPTRAAVNAGPGWTGCCVVRIRRVKKKANSNR